MISASIVREGTRRPRWRPRGRSVPAVVRRRCLVPGGAAQSVGATWCQQAVRDAPPPSPPGSRVGTREAERSQTEPAARAAEPARTWVAGSRQVTLTSVPRRTDVGGRRCGSRRRAAASSGRSHAPDAGSALPVGTRGSAGLAVRAQGGQGTGRLLRRARPFSPPAVLTGSAAPHRLTARGHREAARGPAAPARLACRPHTLCVSHTVLEATCSG